MSDSVTTMRPASTPTVSHLSVVPSGTAQAALADNDDATYLEADGSGLSQLKATFDPFTLPALAILRAVAVRYRAADAALTTKAIVFGVTGVPELTTETVGPLSGSIITYGGASHASTPDGRPWTQDLVNAAFVITGAETFSDLKLYALYLDVVHNNAPTAVVSSVAPATSLAPVVTVTYDDDENDLMERYQVKAFRAAQADPDNPTEAPVWETGEVVASVAAGDTFTVQVPLRLLRNYRTYYFYAKAADQGSDGRYGAWSSATTFTPAAPPAGVPIVGVPYPDPALAAVESLRVQSRHNLLTRDTSTIEGGVGGWSTVTTNCSVAQSTDHAQRDTHSLKVTATANGDMLTGAGLTNVQPGNVYAATAMLFPGATARSAQVFLSFYDVSSVLIGEVSASCVEVAGAWTRCWVAARAPAGAVHARIKAEWLGCTAAEAHYLDSAAILPGTQNMLDNTDFAESTTGWTLTTGGGANVAALAASTGGGQFGDEYVHLGRVTPADVPFVAPTYRIGCQEAETLILSAWLYVPSNAFNTAPTQATFRVENQSGVSFASVLFDDLAEDAWQRRAWQFTVPAGVTAFRPVIFAGDPTVDGTMELRVDGVQLERVDASLANGNVEVAVGGAVVTRMDHFDGVGWVADADPDGLRWSTVTHAGAHSLRLGDVSAAGDEVAIGSWAVASQDVYCAGRTSLTLDYWWELDNVRVSHVKVTFYDAAHQFISPRAVVAHPAGTNDDGTSVYAPNGTDSAGDTGWVHKTFAGIGIPDGAAWANVALAGGWSYDGVNPAVSRWDDLAVTLSGGNVEATEWAPGGWSLGGLAGAATVLERSADGGATWAPVRWPTGTRYLLQPAGISVAGPPYRNATTDHEAERGGAGVLYRAVLVAVDGSDLTQSQPWQYPDAVVLPADSDCLKDPTDPTRNIVDACVAPGVASTSTERQVVGEPFGRPEYAVPSGTVRGEVYALSFAFDDDAAWAAFELLRGSTAAGGPFQPPRVLLLQLRFGDGTDGPAEQCYVRLGPDRSLTRLTSPDMTTAQKRLVVVGARQVRGPA